MIFREYDIRGVYGRDLTDDVAELIGRAYSVYLRERVKKEKLRVSIARDVRLSSDDLQDALIRGIISTGVDVVDIGICPTPLLYFSLFYLSRETHPLMSYICTPEAPEVDGGIMITGSHNPPEYNGFKVCVGKETIYGKAIQELRGVFEALRTKRIDVKEGKSGDVEGFDIISPYLKFMRNHFLETINLKRRIKVVVDSGNGTVGPIVTGLLRDMNCDVVELYCEPDGMFPNHHPDPTVPENLADLVGKVKETGADAGIAYDGDGDRIGVVDSKGEIIFADRLMILLARDILKHYNSSKCIGDAKPTIVFDVKCSYLLSDNIERYGGRPLMWKTGHSLLKGKLKEEKAILAGEMSGHIFFADRFFGYDDAIYASLRLVEILLKEGKGVRKLLSDVPKTYSTPEIRVECPEEEKFKVVEKAVSFFKDLDVSQLPPHLKIKGLVTIDGVRVIFDDGWALVRASNTQPALVLRFEAESKERLEEIKGVMEEVLANIRKYM